MTMHSLSRCLRCLIGFIVLQTAVNICLAEPAPSTAPSAAVADTALTWNAPAISGTIGAPGEVKYYSADLPMMIGVAAVEVLPGTLKNLELLQVDQPGGGSWSISLATSAKTPYSLFYWTRIDNTPGKPQAPSDKPLGDSIHGTFHFAVRALDGKSTGSFTIRVFFGPIVTDFSISNGAISTSNRTVSLNSTAINTDYEYMASETPDFKGAAWIRCTAAPPQFTLSATPGVKTVYLKIRASHTLESNIAMDTILLNTLITLVPGGPAQSATANALGEIVTGAFTVTQPGIYRVETTTLAKGPARAALYGSALIAQDSAKPGSPNTRVLKADLGAGNYTLRVLADSVPCNFSIRLFYDGSANYFTINSFADETNSRIVTLNNRCSGTPSHYIASIYPDFRDAWWQTYSASPAFKLNAGNEKKTAYFKVKYPGGAIAAVQSAQITLRELIPLPADFLWYRGNINPVGEADWYQITVPAENRYNIETSNGTLEDTMMTLYGPYSQTLVAAQDDDAAGSYAARITARLQPGTYYLKVCARFPTESGGYYVQCKIVP